MSTRGIERSERLIEVTNTEIINKTHDLVKSYRRLNMREIVSAVGISSERVHNILHQQLIKKEIVCDALRTVGNDFSRIVRTFFVVSTTVEKRLHYYMHVTKEQSKQWIASKQCVSKK